MLPPVFPYMIEFKMFEEEVSLLYMPPPLLALFEINVQFKMLGEAELALNIPPPVPLFTLFEANAQFEMLGEDI
jgi:hypothetical protein